MRQIILTAVDNNYTFWFDHLIPFLLSLRSTDYQGDVGIISYGLSTEKQQILQKNGCLIFEAPNRYKTIFVDRQWAAAEIAKQHEYEQIALYDTDIWFPHHQFTLFSELECTDKLYCTYETAYGDFIEGCVNPPYQDNVRQVMQQQLYQHKRLWQVGVVAGHQMAWSAYQTYLSQKLSNKTIFTQEYGIDSLLMNLYSVEHNGISVLPEKYNCTPDSGCLRFSNLTAQGDILPKKIFTLNNEPVQGLHITGPFRLWERSFYEYIHHCGIHYFSEGRKYRLQQLEIQDIAVNHFSKLLAQTNLPFVLTQIRAEIPISLELEQEEVVFTVGAKTHIFLQNPYSYPIHLQYAIQPVLGSSLVKGRFVAFSGKTPSVYQVNHWHKMQIPAHEQLILACYDIDTQAKMMWRLRYLDKSAVDF